MVSIDIKTLNEELPYITSKCVNDDEVFLVKANKGNLVLLSEQRFNSMVETMKLGRISKDIDEAVKTSSDKFLTESPFK